MTPQTRILVIDDDLAICEMVQVALETEGYAVACSTGPDALVQVNTYVPDLIVLDLYLDSGDCRQLVADIRATAVGARIPILLMSAHTSFERIAQTLPIQARLAKPFDLEALYALVSQWTSDTIVHKDGDTETERGQDRASGESGRSE